MKPSDMQAAYGGASSAWAAGPAALYRTMAQTLVSTLSPDGGTATGTGGSGGAGGAPGTGGSGGAGGAPGTGGAAGAGGQPHDAATD